MSTNIVVQYHTCSNNHLLSFNGVLCHLEKNLPFHFQYSKATLNDITLRRVDPIELLDRSSWRYTSMELGNMIPFSFVWCKISKSIRIAGIHKVVLT